VRKTIEQEVKDAIDRARKGKANPNNLPLDERLQRSIRGFADRFAEAHGSKLKRTSVTGLVSPCQAGAWSDRQGTLSEDEHLHDYAKAFLANDADGSNVR
jgi:hypothetical protein